MYMYMYVCPNSGPTKLMVVFYTVSEVIFKHCFLRFVFMHHNTCMYMHIALSGGG